MGGCRPTVVHVVPGGYRPGSVAMRAADMADMLAGWRHVLLSGVREPRLFDEELDTVCRSRGLDVLHCLTVRDYLASDGAAAIIAHYPSGVTFFSQEDVPVASLDMPDLAVFSRFERIRTAARGHSALHIGALAGRSSFDMGFVERMLAAVPEGARLFFSGHPGERTPPEVSRAVEERRAFRCPCSAGVVEHWLGMLDLMAMPAGRVSPRLRAEACAAGIVSVVEDSVEKIVGEIGRLTGDRALWESRRREAIRWASVHDMAYESARVEHKLKETVEWRNTSH